MTFDVSMLEEEQERIWYGYRNCRQVHNLDNRTMAVNSLVAVSTQPTLAAL
jgi:hypothetical protein